MLRGGAGGGAAPLVSPASRQIAKTPSLDTVRDISGRLEKRQAR